MTRQGKVDADELTKLALARVAGLATAGIRAGKEGLLALVHGRNDFDSGAWDGVNWLPFVGLYPT